MDFGLAFSFVFKDRDWFKKVAIAALIGLIPIIGQMVVLGWSLNITRRVMNHDENPLPDVDFGADLGRGFYAFVIGFVYTLPISILSGIFGVMDAAITSSSGSDAAYTMIGLFSVCLGLFAFVYGLACAFVLPAAYGNYLAKDSLAAGFNLKEVFSLVRANLGAYLIVVLGTIVAGIIAPVGAIACGIGVLLTYVYSLAIMGHLYGQAYVQATRDKALGEAA
jgi:hypothetical protein